MIDKSLLDNIIVGRVEPHIYAFSTNTIPNYLKVGDTYRPVSERLREWQYYFPELVKEYERSAKIDDNTYFRDFAVHQFLENEKHKERLRQSDIPSEVYYSKEFFKDATPSDVKDAIDDIALDYEEKTQKYQFYNAESRLAETFKFARKENYPLRPNQEATVTKFREAIDGGRTNLLMYAVMRFGKSFTSMCCAVEMQANLVMAVSAKADVMLEWKKTVESHVKFAEYDFVAGTELNRNNHIITEKLAAGRKVVVFLTLQDLQGGTIKDKHQEVFGRKIDLLLVDETHFGARAEKYGEVLKDPQYVKDIANKNDKDDFEEISEAENAIKVIDRNITIHLSGTPYRILMGSEFKKEDIIAFYQFSDIVAEQERWNNKNILDDGCKEWDNPYYGFPQMVRFAFNPNESSRQKLKELKENGVTYAFSALFKPLSIKKATDGSHKKFKYESEILDLLEVIDGSKTDDNLLGFLDYDKIKEGRMCRHIVIVLPYCASCDALQSLIESSRDRFNNLSDYEIINISGIDEPNTYRSPKEIKDVIRSCEENGKKTITLTVNRMLTGSTVPEWDTMLYLKDTASPQEYDQAVFRLQNQFVKTYLDANGDTIKYNMKPQTLLVDFEPNRMFVMQEQKAQVYNVNIDDAGNSKLSERINEELRISPIIVINNDKIERVAATDILTVVSNYAKDKGIKDEALEISVDLSILDIPEVRAVIEKENEIGSKSGLTTPAHEGEDGEHGSELDVPTPDSPAPEEEPTVDDTASPTTDDKKNEEISNTKRIQMFYTRILLYAFITNDRVKSLSEVIESISTEENTRIASNLGLKTDVLSLINEHNNKWALRQLDYKIQDLSDLSHSENMSADERASVAVSKFGKLGDAIVITPQNICEDMIALLPDDFIRNIGDNHGKILDIAGTSGEFAVALYNRMKSLGVTEEIIKDSIYTIPKSSVCYELTRKLYDMLGLNVNNIAANFIATDMLKIKTGDIIDYEKIGKLLRQNKTFYEISLNDDIQEGETDMIKFDAIVGNPPYQIESENTRKPPVYHLFYDVAVALSKYVCLITPARFLFNAGQTPTFWNEKMLTDTHFKVCKYYANSKEVFDSVDIKGGVAITLRDAESRFGALGAFAAHEFLNSINNKVQNFSHTTEYMNSIISSQGIYRFSDKLFEEHPEVSDISGKGTKTKIISRIVSKLPNIFTIAPDDRYDSVALISRPKNERIVRYIRRGYLQENDYIDTYNVIVPESNGIGAFEAFSTPFIANPKTGVTDTFISIGELQSLSEAEHLLKYIKTKFARALLGIKKITQHNPKETWTYVPIQDFSSDSDMDWSKSITEIDQQLYAKYALSPDEIAFIESTIKPME